MNALALSSTGPAPPISSTKTVAFLAGGEGSRSTASPLNQLTQPVKNSGTVVKGVPYVGTENGGCTRCSGMSLSACCSSTGV